MSISRVEYLEDRARVHYNLQKPYGILDVHDAVIEVPYVSVMGLQKNPGEVGYGGKYFERVFIPKEKRTIDFFFYSYQERCVGPNEEDIYGPYLGEEKTDPILEKFLAMEKECRAERGIWKILLVKRCLGFDFDPNNYQGIGWNASNFVGEFAEGEHCEECRSEIIFKGNYTAYWQGANHYPDFGNYDEHNDPHSFRVCLNCADFKEEEIK